VKVLKSPLTGARRNFLREIDILKRLSGQWGVVQLVAAATDAQLTFHACERAHGCSLDQFVNAAEGRDLGVILRHIATLADWLGCLHDLGIAHRDLSPDHVFVGPGDTITVVDFGMAKGTHLLPLAERRRCERYDVQAIGMILWETICGHAIFPYRSPRLHVVLRREMALVQTSGLPLPVQRLVLGCLAARSEFTSKGLPPHRAFESASEVSAALRAKRILNAGLPGDTTATTIEVTSRQTGPGT
jgi:serine/threonine protein kinase